LFFKLLGTRNYPLSPAVSTAADQLIQDLRLQGDEIDPNRFYSNTVY